MSCPSLCRSLIMRTNRAGYKDQMSKDLIGQMVITKYNNRTYRIDDIDFDSHPSSTFDKRGTPVSFTEYYRYALSNLSPSLIYPHSHTPTLFILTEYYRQVGQAYWLISHRLIDMSSHPSPRPSIRNSVQTIPGKHSPTYFTAWYLFSLLFASKVPECVSCYFYRLDVKTGSITLPKFYYIFFIRFLFSFLFGQKYFSSDPAQ